MMRLSLISGLLLGASVSLSAQSTGATVVGIKPAVQVDTGTWSEGELAGRLAGARTPVGGRAGLAFLGGVSLGFSGLIAAAGNPVAMIASVGGASVIGLAASGHVRPSDGAMMQARGHGDAYARGFSEGYNSRAGGRRKTAAIGAGVGGTVAGVGCLFWLLSMLPYT